MLFLYSCFHYRGVIPSRWCEYRRDLKQKWTLKWHQNKWDVDKCDLWLFHPNTYSVYHTAFLSPFSLRNFKSWTLPTNYFSAAIRHLIHASLLIKQQCTTVNVLHNVRFVAQLIVQWQAKRQLPPTKTRLLSVVLLMAFVFSGLSVV